MLTALQGHFTKISSNVRKLRRKRERSVSTAVSTAGQKMTEPENVFRSREISAVTVRIGIDCSRHFQSFVVPLHKHQKCKTNMVLAELQY